MKADFSQDFNLSPCVLSQAHSALDSEQVSYVRKTVDWLLGQCFSSGNLRSSLGSKDDKLVHWCHGAPGAIYTFLEAYKVRLS